MEFTLSELGFKEVINWGDRRNKQREEKITSRKNNTIKSLKVRKHGIYTQCGKRLKPVTESVDNKPRKKGQR